MPHRISEYIEFCSLCDLESTDSCPRCGRGFCEEHLLDDNMRCGACEEHFSLLLKRKGLLEDIWNKIDPYDINGSYLMVFLATALGMVGFKIGGLLTAFVLAGVLCGIAFPPYLHRKKIKKALRKRDIESERKRFLEEKPVLKLES